MTKCIYCLESKPIKSFTNTEHVIPQSFGVFKNNFTLKKVVCNDCNKYFGENLELDLARDTYEGQSRFEFNVKAANNYKSYGKKSRLIIRVAGGPLKGIFACREYSPGSNKIVLKPLPQMGFKQPNADEYVYYLLNEVPDKKYLEENFELSNPHGIRSYGMDMKRLEDKLREKGISLNSGGEFIPRHESDTLLYQIEGTIDRKIFRAISKVAFNYFAYWQDSEFMCQKTFNTTRRYIRYDETALYPIVDVLAEPILADETGGSRRLGHIVTVNWAADNVSIVSQVSLFNWVKYTICLSRDYSGERRPIKKGHFFNTKNKEILELGSRN